MRRKGFTLIELLVVIAIIGILAAMLFPVFARARESARKTQCLANVKNIATAINMYLADWDRLFPHEVNRAVIDYFNSGVGQGSPKCTWPEVCNHVDHANPYIREPVVLEDYVKSIDVWKCPSAKIMNGASFIIPMGVNGDWTSTYKNNEGNWGRVSDVISGPCSKAYPPGWGGDVTDSIGQQKMASVQQWGSPTGAASGVFIVGIGCNVNLIGLNTSTVQDAGRYVACGDTGKQDHFWEAQGLAYPDTCCFNYCGGTSCPATCAWADWVNCSWTQICGLGQEQWPKAMNDSMFRKQFQRHMGGSNVGFLDGHAKWFLADVICTQSEPFEDAYFQGLCSCWPGNGVM